MFSGRPTATHSRAEQRKARCVYTSTHDRPAACVFVCVCVVQLCVFPGPHVVTFMRGLTSCLLNCADCVNLKMGQPALTEAN